MQPNQLNACFVIDWVYSQWLDNSYCYYDEFSDFLNNENFIKTLFTEFNENKPSNIQFASITKFKQYITECWNLYPNESKQLLIY